MPISALRTQVKPRVEPWNSSAHRGAETLAGMEQLEGLHLVGAKITDAGLVHLARMVRLKTLNLTFTAIADPGLEHLTGLIDRSIG